MKNPVLHRAALRKAFKGVVGRPRPTDEDQAMRAAASRAKAQRDADIEEAKSLQRKTKISKRILHRMRAAEYARDRRAE
jgi:hypothetical protein